MEGERRSLPACRNILFAQYEWALCNVKQATSSVAAHVVSSVDSQSAHPAGPKDKLDSTAVSQPAIYVASLAAIEKLRATEGEVHTKEHWIMLLMMLHVAGHAV